MISEYEQPPTKYTRTTRNDDDDDDGSRQDIQTDTHTLYSR